MNVGENIRRIRKSRRMTMKELGKRVGISEQGIGNYERGYREPNLDILCKVAKELSVSIDELFIDSRLSFSRKLLKAILEMNYVYLIGNFSDSAVSDTALHRIEAISKETNINMDSLQKCIDENIELTKDEQVKLINFWHDYKSPEDGVDLEYFIDSNHKHIVTHPALYRAVKTIFKKEAPEDNFDKLLDLLEQNGFEVSISNKNGINEIKVFKGKINIVTTTEADFTAAYVRIVSRINSYSKFIIEEELRSFHNV